MCCRISFNLKCLYNVFCAFQAKIDYGFNNNCIYCLWGRLLIMHKQIFCKLKKHSQFVISRLLQLKPTRGTLREKLRVVIYYETARVFLLTGNVITPTDVTNKLIIMAYI